MIRAVLTIIFLFASIASAQTPLANLAGSTPAGSWAELVSTNNGVLNQPGTSGHITEYAADAAWNPVAKKFCFIGNDHIDANPSQALRFVCYDEATNAWQNLAAPPFSQAGSTDHGYYHHAVNPANGDIYRRGGKSSGVIWRLRAGMWTALPPLSMETSYACCGSLEYFPELGGLVLVQSGENGGGSIYLFTEATQTWSKLADNIAPLTGSTFTAGAYSSVAKILIFGQGGSFYKLDANRVITSIASPPFVFYDGAGFLGNIVADPVSGKFVALSATNRAMFTFDPATNAWATLNSANKPNFINYDVIAAPIPSYGVILYNACLGTNCRNYLYKFAASTSTPTPIPPTPPTTGFPMVVEAETMTTKTTGGPAGNGFYNIWSNGYIESTISFPNAGKYRFTIRAYGSPALGVYPTMQLRINQVAVAAKVVTGTAADHIFEIDIQAGSQRVAIAFINDENTGIEDRNLLVDKTTIAPSTSVPDTPSTLPLGPLTHDGPATPEQLALIIPVTGALPQTATATVRHRPSGSATWTIGHSMFRIQPSLSDTPAIGTVIDAFAWPIVDLQPGTAYDVEATVTSGSISEVKTATMTTRALPEISGPANKTLSAGATLAAIQATLDALNAGDVLQLAEGTYPGGWIIRRSGTATNPIRIRGVSRTGTIISNPSRLIQIQNASDVLFENFTGQGSGIDSGTNASSVGIEFYSGTPNQTRITIRNVTIAGVDRCIGQSGGIIQVLIYDNACVGNNQWTSTFIDTNLTWNDDGINLGGIGNVAFNNTMRGFGDCLAYASHAGGETTSPSTGVHFYRNELRNCGDDAVEADHSLRNNTFIDNRVHNAMSFQSLDPLYGGPFLMARNIAVNIGRTPFKWNSANSGQFIYNNTIIRTTGKFWVDGNSAAEAGWYQPNNGSQVSYGFRNNLLVYRGAGAQTIRLDNSGHSPVDFTHNSWFPDTVFQWPQGRYNNLAAAYSGLSTSVPVFSGATKRHEQDNITVSNPWTTAVQLGSDYRTEVTGTFLPVLSAGTSPKNSGVSVAGITNGFSGTAPDRGAVIEGRTLPVYGDRSGSQPVPPDPPPVTGPIIFKGTGTLTDANGQQRQVSVEMSIR